MPSTWAPPIIRDSGLLFLHSGEEKETKLGVRTRYVVRNNEHKARSLEELHCL